MNIVPLDIFSRSKRDVPQPEPVTIIVDNREKNSLVPSELMRMNCAICFRQLPIGDYICNNFIVERKTISDLQNSITNKRLFGQMDSISSQSNPVLMIEGDFSEWGMHPNVYRGIIASAARKRIPVILTSSPSDTASYLAIMARESAKDAFSFRPYKRLMSRKDSAKYILEGFEGIGPVTAKALIDRFGSIKSIVNAAEEELRPILGKKYESFKDAIS